jgi:hypothetical protein
MPQYTIKNGMTTLDVRLDRVPIFDPRSLDFLIRDLLSDEHKNTLVTKLWDAPPGTPVLDQGQEGACTGFGTTNELLWNPVPVPGLDATFAREKIYWAAQKTDPWPGGSYPGANPQYEGTGVLYAIKAAAKLGYYAEYRWAKSENDMARGVSHLGPAIIGINWTEDMFRPDADNYIHPTGSIAGGHCILATGIDINADCYILHNSWGPTWGQDGNCKIKRSDMAKLLRDQGECCIITARLMPLSDTNV